MTTLRRAQRLIAYTYLATLLAVLACAAALIRGVDGFVFARLASLSAALLATVLVLGSAIATGALTRTRSLRATDVIIVALGWLGAIALAVYAVALGG
jgi:hypothetical protein